MSIQSLINKGKEAITNVANSAAQKYNDYKEANQEFQNLIASSTPLSGFMLCENYDRSFNSFRKNQIINLIPSINRETAEKIDRILPDSMSILMIFRGTESKTNKLYYFLVTSGGLYITDTINYLVYDYSSIENLEIIVKGVMSSNVSFNHNAFNFEISETGINKLVSFISDESFRNNAINESIKYLCGKEINKQYINNYGVGITVTKDNMIVLHNKDISNEIINKKEIKRIDVLSDNSTIMTRGENENKMLSSKQGCYELVLKIIFSDCEKQITILPKNNLGTMYMREDTIYNDSIDFCKILIEELLKRD